MARLTNTALPLALAAAGWLLFTPLLRGQEQKSAFQRGIEASYKGDYDLAIASFSEAIRRDSTYVPAYNDRGNIYKARGDYDKAIADYDESIRIDPKYVPAYINRGIAYAAMGDGNKALADYNQAILLDPGNGLAYVNRGLLREAGDDYEKALADFEKAIHLDSGDGLAYNNLAWLLATCPQAPLRNGKKAVEYANKACELAQWKNPDWVDTLAAACAEAEDFAQAVKWETKYLETPNLSKGSAVDAAGRLKLYQARQPYRSGKQ
jgi:tetratricopeptide (TPR) repeat protein